MIRVTATMSLWSKTIAPDQISAKIGVMADNKVIKGSERNPPRPRPDAHGWHMLSQAVGEDPPIGETLDRLLKRVEDFFVPLMSFRDSDPALEIIFSVSVAPAIQGEQLPADHRIAMFVSRDVLNMIADLDADLDLEVHSYRD